MGPSSKEFFGPKWDPRLRIFGKKVTHLGGTSPYALTCEYPPPPEHTSLTWAGAITIYIANWQTHFLATSG